MSLSVRSDGSLDPDLRCALVALGGAMLVFGSKGALRFNDVSIHLGDNSHRSVIAVILVL